MKHHQRLLNMMVCLQLLTEENLSATDRVKLEKSVGYYHIYPLYLPLALATGHWQEHAQGTGSHPPWQLSP